MTTGDAGGPHRDELAEVLRTVLAEAGAYLETLDQRAVRGSQVLPALARLDEPFPESGHGAAASLRLLLDAGIEASVHGSGPRFFHFVMGGVTPAAMGADMLAAVLDQVASSWVTSPLAVSLEQRCIEWLRDLFGLPAALTGLLVTGATMANFTALATARQWCGEQVGWDVAEQGLAGGPELAVFSSGHLHASTVKALAMLGMGRACIRRFAGTARGDLDRPALRRALAERGDRPTILVANAGEVNSGAFDPIDAMADLAAQSGSWLHVDGAFGLFARVCPSTASLCDGVERADSVTVDAHKWLNVPYDCGVALVRHPGSLARTFTLAADYLPRPEDPRPNFSTLGPESSRRARALALWCTLRAYGREGYRALVQRSLDLARRMAQRIDAAPDLVRLAPVPLNIVCFRYDPGGLDEPALDALNTRLGEALLADGRFFAGTTRYGSRVALRPALVNWRTRAEDVDAFVDVVRELGGRCRQEG